MNNEVVKCVLAVGLYMHLCWAFQEQCLWRISPYPEKEPSAQQGLGSISHSGTVWITLAALSGKRASDTCSLLTSHITYTWRSQNHRTIIVGKGLWRLSGPIKSWQPGPIYSRWILLKWDNASCWIAKELLDFKILPWLSLKLRQKHSFLPLQIIFPLGLHLKNKIYLEESY